MHNHLLDKEFLRKLFNVRSRETYARVIAFSNDENPLETLEGKITQGSINIDGNSSLRRSCSLTFSTSETGINSYYWALTNKFKLEIGLKNEVDTENYPSVVYFPFGTFIITSFSVNKGVGNYSVSIQGKDKMCLINGEVGGALFAQHDFGTETYIDRTTTPPTVEIKDFEIENIIREIVHNYAHEPYQNIIVKDIPKYGMYIMNFIGGTGGDPHGTNMDTLYALVEVNKTYDSIDQDKVVELVDFNKVNSVLYGGVEYKQLYSTPDIRNKIKLKVVQDSYKSNGTLVSIEEQEVDINQTSPSIRAIANGQSIELPFKFYKNDVAINIKDEDSEFNLRNYTKVYDPKSNKECVVVCINKGQAAGYKLTTLTYPRDVNKTDSGLVVGVGEGITSALDKIVNMLGDYEYFYNEYGQFVFQKRPSYANRSWYQNDFEINSVTDTLDINALPTTYWNFEGNELVSSISNSPNINNIRNDFSIWGNLPGANQEIPIHLRYAIDRKPTRYTTIRVDKEEVDGWMEIHREFKMKPQTSITYIADTETDFSSSGSEIKVVDWRELIYQMAQDYLKYNHFDTFYNKIEEANCYIKDGKMVNLYPGGKTGYEQYYVDLDGFWRQIYNPLPYEDYFCEKDSEGNYIVPQETLISEFNLAPSTYNVSKLDKEIFIKGSYHLVDSPSAANAIWRNEEEDLIDLNEGGYFEVNKYLENNKFFRLVFSEEDGLVCDPALSTNPIQQIGYEGKNIYVDLHNLDKGLIEVVPGNVYKTDGYAILPRFETKGEEFLNEFVGTRSFNKETMENEKLDFMTIYTIKDKMYMLYSTMLLDGFRMTPIIKCKEIIRGAGNICVWSDSKQAVYVVTSDGVQCRLIYNCSDFSSTSDFYYGNGIDKENKRIKLELVEDINNLTYDPLNCIYINYSPEGYTPVSTLPLNLKTLFFKGSYSIFSKEDYKANYKKAVRKPSGDLTGAYELFDITYYQATQNTQYSSSGWNELKISNPETLIFWFDFLDRPGSEIDKMNVKNIMDRSKAVNESEIKSIYYRENLNLFYLLNPNGSINYEDDGYVELVDKFSKEEAETKIIELEELLTKNQEFYDKLRKAYEKEDEDFKEQCDAINKEELTDEQKQKKLLELTKQKDEAQNHAYSNLILNSANTELEKIGQDWIEYDTTPKKMTLEQYKDMKFEESLQEQSRLKPYIESTYSEYVYADNNEANYFAIGSTGKSCKDVLDQFLYNFTYATTSVNITTVPIYHLQPNDIVILNDEEAMVEGKYIVNSISIPLTYNGTMSIMATKLVNSLY